MSDLTVEAGKVHAIMGPNGSGKSTLSYVLSGRDGYVVTDGTATLLGEDLLAMETEERAAAGLFLAFQYPVEIPGVGQHDLPAHRAERTAQGARRGRGSAQAIFSKLIRAKAKDLQIDADMLKRPVNVGFSGGEKKRNEILQMALLEPKMCILDETDSGLDVDAMKAGLRGRQRAPGRRPRFFSSSPTTSACSTISIQTWCTIMSDGRIVKTGGPELALEVEKNGYADILEEVA